MQNCAKTIMHNLLIYWLSYVYYSLIHKIRQYSFFFFFAVSLTESRGHQFSPAAAASPHHADTISKTRPAKLLSTVCVLSFSWGFCTPYKYFRKSSLSWRKHEWFWLDFTLQCHQSPLRCAITDFITGLDELSWSF